MCVLFRLTLVSFLLSACSVVSAQRLIIAEIVTDLSQHTADVPIYVDDADSLNALQIGIVWDSTQLIFDSITLSQYVVDFSYIHDVSQTNAGELRFVIGFDRPASGKSGPFTVDSLIGVLHFKLAEPFVGPATVAFGGGLPTVFSHYNFYTVYPELLDGGVLSGNTVAVGSRESEFEGSVYPNPIINGDFYLRSNLSPPLNSAYSIADATGRVVATGTMAGNRGVIPPSLPKGTYFLLLRRGEERAAVPIIVN